MSSKLRSSYVYIVSNPEKFCFEFYFIKNNCFFVVFFFFDNTPIFLSVYIVFVYLWSFKRDLKREYLTLTHFAELKRKRKTQEKLLCLQNAPLNFIFIFFFWEECCKLFKIL